jgi:peptidoglycan/LPS O-acetylase OafA/YrhL
LVSVSEFVEIVGLPVFTAGTYLRENFLSQLRIAPTVATCISVGRNNFNLMRLVAAWLVIYSHSWAITGSAGSDVIGTLTLVKSGGALAVEVFFLISGFLVAASFQRNSLRDFLLARAMRIYPALIVCVLLSVCVLGFSLSNAPDYWSDGKTWRYFWANASLWRAEFWLPGVFDALPRTAVNGSLWTLPIEARLYVALMIAGLAGMLAPWRYLAAWLLAIVGAGVFAYQYAPLPEHLAYLIWVTVFFITGTLFWVFRQKIVLSIFPLLALLAAFVAVRGTTFFALVYVPLLAYGTFYIALIPRLPVIAKTDLSYGLYLYGWPMQQLALLVGAGTVFTNTVVGTIFALTCAALSWILVEHPALRCKQRLIQSRQISEAAGPSVDRTQRL